MITPHRMLRGLALVAALASCAPRGAAVPEAGSQMEQPGGGVIVAVRPVDDGGRADSARARILGMFGAAGAAGHGTVEFIVRADGGRTISVMQEDAGGLRPGARVMLARGARTRIVPAGPGS